MTDYNDGKWHGWNGGECPVHPKTKVDVKFWNGYESTERDAEEWDWSDTPVNIVAFRVTKPYVEPKKPREVFLCRSKVTGSWYQCSSSYDDKVLFREVLNE